MSRKGELILKLRSKFRTIRDAVRDTHSAEVGVSYVSDLCDTSQKIVDARKNKDQVLEAIGPTEAGSLFDPAYYLSELARSDQIDNIKSNPDLKTLLAHYLSTGWEQGRDPSRHFSTDFYLRAYEDVAESGINPLVHYIRYGRAEGRISQSCTKDELALAARVVDPKFYLYRYQDLLRKKLDPVEHYAVFGWREQRDPNPFSMIRFIKRHSLHGEASYTDTLNHLLGAIYHNPLMRRPATLSEIYDAFDQDVDALENLFIFDVVSYAATQHDVLSSEFWINPVEHLFFDGLSQNRLRNGRHLHKLLVPIETFVNDHDFVTTQEKPLTAASFRGLSLASPAQENNHVLDGIYLYLGVVLYKNSKHEIERLVRSVKQNTKNQKFRAMLGIWDNSPESLDLAWIEDVAPDLNVEIYRNPENPGFALGHNGLMAHGFSNGADHYLGLNPDGYLIPSSLEHLLKFAATKKSPSLIEMDCEPVSHPKWYHPVTGETDWVSGVAFLLDIRAYELTGGFDPNFPMYCEDVDLSFRARMSGVKLYVCPRGRYYHDTSGRLSAVETWRTERMMVGTVYLCLKWGNPERANLLITEMRRAGFATSELPTPPTEINDIPSDIRDLMRKERFAVSRFWNE